MPSRPSLLATSKEHSIVSFAIFFAMHHTMESKKEVTYKLFFKSTRSNFDWGWGSQRSLASGEPTSKVIGFIEVAYFSLHFHRDSQDQKGFLSRIV